MTDTQITLAYLALTFGILLSISFISWVVYLKSEIIKERNMRIDDGNIILERANEIAEKFSLFHIDYKKEKQYIYSKILSINSELSDDKIKSHTLLHENIVPSQEKLQKQVDELKAKVFIAEKPTTIRKKDHFIINTTPKKKVTTKTKKK